MPMVYTHGRRMALQRLGLKLAASLNDDRDRDIPSEVAMGGVLGGTALHGLSGQAVGLADKALDAESPAVRAQNEALSRKIIDEHNREFNPVRFHSSADVNAGKTSLEKEMAMAHYDPMEGHVVADLARPAEVAHELGHAQNHSQLGKLYPTLGTAGRIVFMGTGPMAAGYGYLQDPKAEDNPLGVAGAASLAQVPVLADEAAASLRGMGKLHPHGYNKGTAAEMLAPAFGTYLGKSLANVGGSVLGYEATRGVRNWNDKDK